MDGVSLSVGKGEFVALIGPSGCGKTTTLRLVAGFETPSSGSVVHDGRDITQVPPQERNMPMVFQNYALFPHMTVFENIGYGLRVRDQAPDAVAHDVAMVSQMFNLVGIEHRYPRELSDGQQQRVALARALVLKPRVILFDEPLSNLDARLRLQTRSEIKRVQRLLGITVIYVTHDQTEALSMPDRLAIMNRGRIVQAGPPEDIYNSPATPFVSDFIGSANFLDAVVSGLRGSRVVVSVNGSEFSIPASRCDEGLAPGDEALLSIMPEAIGLRDSGEGRSGAPRGVVELVSFMGPTMEYKVSFGDATLTVSRPNVRGRTSVHRIGREVSLQFESDSLRLFRA